MDQIDPEDEDSVVAGRQVEWEDVSYESLLESAFVALEEGNPADAETFLRHADERFPGDPDVQLGLADALLRQEDPRAAEQVRHAAELAGDDPYRLMRAANQAFQLDDWPATAALTAEARRLAPEDFAHAAMLLYLAGMVARQDGDVELAEQMLEGAFERAPEDYDFAVSLVDVLAEHGNPDRAYDVVEQALERHPGDEYLLAMREHLLEAD